MPKVKFVHREDLEGFSEEVQAMLAQGWDFSQGPVVMEDGIGQWMVESKSFYKYALLITPSPEALNRLVDVYVADGWDLYCNTVTFKGDLLQWMWMDTSLDRWPEKMVATEIGFA